MKENLNSILKSEYNTSIDDLNFSQHVVSSNQNDSKGVIERNEEWNN